MQAIRHLIARRRLATLVCAIALLLKLLIPAGYMIDSAPGGMTITICSGDAPRTMTMAMSGMAGDMADHGRSRDHGKAEMPCAFAALSAVTLGAIDPLQLAALIAFVMAIGLAGVASPAPDRPRHLRPPLRGPPA